MRNEECGMSDEEWGKGNEEKIEYVCIT